MKPYYYTFEWKDRVITLCLDYDKKYPDYLNIGYSVKIPQDNMNEELSKKIALGRNIKRKTRLSVYSYENHYVTISNSFIKEDKGVLKAIARNCERNIKNGTIVIKGIR